MATDRDVPPPKLRKRTPIRTVTGRATVGHVGPMPSRDCLGFAKPVKRSDHHFRYLRKERGGAYAISDDALERLQGAGADRILVIERDTKDVYEFDASAFTKTVPNHFLHGSDDPQTYAVCTQAYVWEDHADDVYLPQVPFEEDDADA